MSSSQFTFVPVDVAKKNNRDLVTADDRLMIRSLAARNPWNRPTEGEQITPGVRRRRNRKPTTKPPTSKVTLPPLPPSEWSRDSSESPDEDEIPTKSLVPPSARSSPTPTFQTLAAAVRSTSPCQSLSGPVNSPLQHLDPYWSFSVPYRQFMPPILNHRLSVISRPIPLLDTSMTKSESQKWALNQLFIIHNDSPPFMYATLLFAGAHLDAGEAPERSYAHRSLTKNESRAIATEQHLLYLRFSAIKALNENLSDPALIRQPKKFSSTLAAISTLATFEFYFGDRKLQKMHLEGSRRLIQLKGGLNGLDDLSRRFYLFILKTFLTGPPDGSGGGGPGVSEYGIVVSVLRDILRDSAEELGYDLDAIIEADES